MNYVQTNNAKINNICAFNIYYIYTSDQWQWSNACGTLNGNVQIVEPYYATLAMNFLMYSLFGALIKMVDDH